uniref:Uncharacterized protein n=1 Tax=Photinus pyralis TaxID=7054 RepID=A0A1Y1M2F3_PHOPY
MWSTWIPNHEYPGACYGSLFIELFLPSIPPKDQRQKVFLFFDGVLFPISCHLVIPQENEVVPDKIPPNVHHPKHRFLNLLLPCEKNPSNQGTRGQVFNQQDCFP